MEYLSPFTNFIREHHRLRDELDRRLEPLETRMRELETTDQLRTFSETGPTLIQQIRQDPPRLGGKRAARIERGHWGRRREDGAKPAVVRHYYAVQVLGDATLVPTWPTNETGLSPIDDEGSDAFIGEDEPEWIIRTVSSDPSDDEEWALYTHFDLTPGQEADVVEGRLDLQSLFDARLARIQPIVDRIHQEVLHYYSELLPERMNQAIEKLRSEFAVREAVSRTFSFPDEWILQPPKLAVPREAVARPETPESALNIPYVARLDPADFHRLQRTIRVWADAVERYPVTFAPLAEDRISDLLAATLRATHPTADREVFSRKGKTDILVHANVLADGAEPAVVFITESKWATQEKVIQEAVDPQLFGYLNASDTAAVLLVLLGQLNRRRAEAKYLRALEGVAGHYSTNASAVRGWPLLGYRIGGSTLQLCVAFIHLPRA